MSEEPSFSAGQARAAQEALRRALGLGPERFPLPALVEMLGDEIARMRATGGGDAEAERLISAATGVAVPVEAIARHHRGDA